MPVTAPVAEVWARPESLKIELTTMSQRHRKGLQEHGRVKQFRIIEHPCIPGRFRILGRKKVSSSSSALRWSKLRENFQPDRDTVS
jgi:hypothetical protein